MDQRPVTMVVHIWHFPEGVKVVVRPLGGKETYYFASLDELLQYLAQAPGPECQARHRPRRLK